MSDNPVTRISYADLVALLEAIFVRHGVSADAAAVLAANCAGCERDGALSHGIFRIPGYVSTLESGWVDGKAIPQVRDCGAGLVRVDARNGFAQPALAAGREMAVEKARSAGIAALAIGDSHHFSALWPDVEPFAEMGFVALSFVNSMACVVPVGGHTPVFGTNPIAFASPRADGPPFVFDQAASSMAHGDVQIAARAGRSLPEGVAVDSTGSPTTDAQAVLEGGALLPFGGYKGNSIALMVEILGAALTGGQFSREVDWTDFPGAQTPKTGQLVILIDPESGGNQAFGARVAGLLEAVREAGQERLPGDKRYRTRKESLATGVALASAELERLRALAGST